MRIIGNTPVDGEVRAVASGTLANGDTVVINSDGTVSAVTLSGPAFGASSVFESASTSIISSTFDSSSNKVVVAYADEGNSYALTAVVGTISGNSISFGTPVAVAGTSPYRLSITYDSNADKVVVAYIDANSGYYGVAVVGTVSGNSISFGTPVFFQSSVTPEVSAVFNGGSNSRIVIAFSESSRGYMIVGTVSGTSISFGTRSLYFNGNLTEISIAYTTNNDVVAVHRGVANPTYCYARVATVGTSSVSFPGSELSFSGAGEVFSATYDNNSSLLVIIIRNSSTNYGAAVVGSISGGSISFNSPVTFESSGTFQASSTFDSFANKILVTYRDNDDSGKGKLAIGTLSGGVISFSTPLVFESASTNITSITYNAQTNSSAVFYKDSDNSGFGTASVFEVAPTNASKYVGIAYGTYADGEIATIQTGCSINDAQSGLTPGQEYYVQADGTLGTTPDTPSVKAGLALSSNKLLIKR